MKELTQNEINRVNGGLIPVLIAVGKGIGWGIGAGAALYGVAFATASYYKE